MKAGDLVTWSGPSRAVMIGEGFEPKHFVGLVLEGPEHFGFVERVYVLWGEYPKLPYSEHSPVGGGNCRWIDVSDLMVISENKYD